MSLITHTGLITTQHSYPEVTLFQLFGNDYQFTHITWTSHSTQVTQYLVYSAAETESFIENDKCIINNVAAL